MTGRAATLKPLMGRREPRLRLDARRLLVALLFLAIFFLAVRVQPADSDTWWHLKSGELMWQTGRVLRADPFSHTVAGLPWIDHGWLVQLALWPLYRAAGLPGLALLLAAFVAGAFALAYRQSEGRPFVAALITLLAAVSTSVIWAMRPQIVTFFLAAVVAYLLDGYRRSGRARRLWPIPLLIVVWVNCHAGFVVAFILMGCYLAGESLNRLAAAPGEARPARPGPLAAVLAASLPAVLLNPNTIHMLPYAFQTMNIGPLQSFIQEWATPNFHNLQLQPFIWLLLLTLAAMAVAGRPVDWTDLALIGVFGYLGLLAVRNVALFALVAAPVLSRYAVGALNELSLRPHLSWLAVFGHTAPPPRPGRSLIVLNLSLLALALLAVGDMVLHHLQRLDEPEVWGQGLPVEAAAYLSSHELPGRMFNTYNWGGYLIWSLYPDKPVFVDGRTDLYAFHGVLDDYVQVHLARPGWRQVLARYQVGHVITERGGLLDTVMDEAEDWQPVYRDETAGIYVPAAPGSRAPAPAQARAEAAR